MNESTQEISLLDLISILFKHIVLIVSVTLLGLLIAYVYAFHLGEQRYESSAYLSVRVQIINGNVDITQTQRLVESAAELIKMPVILNQVIHALELDMTSDELLENMTVVSSKTSYLIQIRYVADDPMLSKAIVNQIFYEARTYANESVPALRGNLSRESYPERGELVEPNQPLILVIGFLLGGIVSVMIVFIIEFTRNAYMTKKELEEALGVPVIGIIPALRKGDYPDA